MKNCAVSLKQLLEMYDDWNGITRINNDELNTIIEEKTYKIYHVRKDLLDKEVVAFGFYDGVMTVRVK